MRKLQIILLICLLISTQVFCQSPCNLSTYSSTYILKATDYPYFSAGSGITVSASVVGVTSLSNTSYSCGGQTFATASPAWWLNSPTQSITLSFSSLVSSITVVFNGTGIGEEFYFNSSCGGLSVSNYCSSGFSLINGGTGLICNVASSSGSIATLTIPGGTNSITLTHNGASAGSRIAMLDCIVPAPPGGGSSTINPVANITVCNGTSVPASAFSTTPAGGTFTWTNSNTTIGLAASGSGNTPSFTAVNNTGSSITSTITVSSPASGCSPAPAPITYTITVDPSANPSWTVPTVSCSGSSSINLDSQITGTTGGTWSGTGVTGNLFNPAVGTQSVTYTVGSGACQQSSTQTITVTASGSPTWTNPSPICETGGTINLDLLITGTTGGTWSGTGVSGNTFDPINGTQSVTYTIGSGTCQLTSTQTITVNPDVDPSWTNPSPLCENVVTFNLNPSITGTTGGTWSGTGVSGNSFTLSSGTQAVTYTVGAVGCQESSTQTITVIADVDPTWTNPSPLCENAGTFNLNPTLTGTTGGTWSGTGINGNTFTLSSGTQAITYTVGAVGCQETSTQTITVISDVDPTWSLPTGICENDIAFDLNTYITGTTGGSWSGNGVSGTFFSPSAGTQQVTYTVGSTPCVETHTQTIIVSPIPQVVAQTQTADLCEGESINLFASSPNSGINAQFTWTSPEGNNYNMQNPAIPNSTLTNTGYYSVVVTDNGCTSETDSVLVTIHALPNVSFSGTNLIGCPKLCPSIQSNTTTEPASTVTNYIWTLSNGATYSGQSFTDCFQNNGSSDIMLNVTLQATTNFGCVNQTTQNSFITVYSNPVASFNYNPTTLDVMNTEVHFNNNSSNADSYYWYFEGQNSSVDVNPSIVFPEVANSYEVFLVAYTNNGCVDTMKTTITVNDIVIFYVPNSFSPDGDEFNPVFKPIFTSGFDPYSYSLIIFDRWGEQLFESHDTNIGWDGTYQGQIVKEGTYIWKIKFKEPGSDKKQEHQGHLNVIK